MFDTLYAHIRLCFNQSCEFRIINRITNLDDMRLAATFKKSLILFHSDAIAVDVAVPTGALHAQ